MKKILVIFSCIFSCLLAEEEMIDNFKIEGYSKKPEATLDLTITKLESKDLVGVINKKRKEATISIKDTGDIVIFDDLDDFSTVTVEGEANTYSKILNINHSLNQGKRVKIEKHEYELVNFENARFLKIYYKGYPRDLYLGILDKGEGLEKVYKLKFEQEKININGLKFIVNNSEKLVFDIKETRGLENFNNKNYIAQSRLSLELNFQLGEEVEPILEVVPKQKEIILKEIRSGSSSKNKLKEITAKKITITLEEVKEVIKEDKIYRDYIYRIKGEIEKEEVRKIIEETSEDINTAFVGNALIDINIK